MGFNFFFYCWCNLIFLYQPLVKRQSYLVVGQRGGESYQPDLLLRGLDLPHGPRHQRLEDGAAVVVQQVDLVEDDQPEDRVGSGSISNI